MALASEEIAAWFEDAGNRTPVVIGLNLAAISSVAFLWFVAVIRRRIGEREDRFFATVFLGSGILYIGMWLVAATLLGAAAVSPDLFAGAAVDKASHPLMAGTAGGLLLVAGPRVQAVFVLLGTRDERNYHLYALSSIAGMVQDANFTNRWMRARDERALRDVVLERKEN